MKYIENNIEFGIEYDYQLIMKEYKKIVPKDFYFICKIPFGKVGTVIEFSERSIGKTTNFLILGMIMNQMYGTITQYVRSREDEVMNKTIQDLFDTILKYDYVSKITKNKYNSVIYERRRWYYVKIENNEIIEKCDKHFMFCCSIQKSKQLKSSYNCPTGDLIIFDEFINKYYITNEFIDFLDLTKTIIRKRYSATIVMLANTIDIENEYFDELECRDILLNMEQGDKNIYETEIGTINYIEWLDNLSVTKREEKNSHNKKYYGYKNGKLNAITGYGWSLNEYQHIIERNPTLIYRYIKKSGRIIRIELQKSENLGYYCNCVPCKKIFDNEIIFTLDKITSVYERYKFGHTKTDKFIFSLYQKNKFYYATNGVGSFIENYIKQCLIKK